MSISVKAKNYINNIGYFKLFIVIETIAIAVFLTLNCIWHGWMFSSMMLRIQTQFDDFFVHLGLGSAPIGTNIYEYSTMACFPPLAYLMYGFLAHLSGYQAELPTAVETVRDTGFNMMVLMLYNLICIVLLVYAVSLYFKKKSFVTLALFPALLIFSYPILFSSVQRGNSAFLTSVLLAIALAWRNDQSKVKRELAMILIAVCTGLKIYPAVFGLMYLKEKRWGETVRLVIYGIVLFFLPFIFYGGFEGMRSFFGIIFGLFGEIHACTVSGIVLSLVKDAFGTKAVLFASIVQQLYLIFSLIAFFCAKDKRTEILILCCLMTVYISSGWMYTCVFILPALLTFFSEQEGKPIRWRVGNIPDYMAFVMFLSVFSRPVLLGGYMFIYYAIVIISVLYHLVIIGAAVNRRWIKPFLAA